MPNASIVFSSECSVCHIEGSVDPAATLAPALAIRSATDHEKGHSAAGARS